ncbi:UNKNOWN [Stylonychia lemnae]|uniref:6-pyruvoyltetrahydropterin synthase n=1 Tax=Stylonychia lemnae TaxID=5949 RepID=A0A078B3S5_STYLE|nr:UNKNOWN [Stylonychia lemnae]|eukprot:CDW89129.1 UNKNOWN [Stylonychia lemnae]
MQVGSVLLEKESLRFFAAHFIARFGKDGKVERETLHGHNYRMIVRVAGQKQSNQAYIIDKNEIQEICLKICRQFHSKMLIPRLSPALGISEKDNHVFMQVKGTDEIFQFPKGDCLILDLEYTSIEGLASHCAKLIKEELMKNQDNSHLTEIYVTIREYQGLECQMCEQLQAKL